MAVAASRYPHDTPAHEVIDGVAVHRFPFLEALSQRGIAPAERFATLARTLRTFSALKTEFRPDVVHINMTDAIGFFHLRTTNPHRAATVVTVHMPLGAAYAERGGVVAQLAAEADAIVSVSNATAALAATGMRLPRAAIDVIPPGVPAGNFPPRVGLPSGPPAFVVMGRIVPEKGVDVAIAAMRDVPDAVLTVVGDGPEEPGLVALADRLGVAGRVRFAGVVENTALAPVLHAADALLVPSTYEEPFGIVAVEAALAGLPSIVSRVGGLKDIVVNGETGLVVPPSDADALAAAMRRLASDRAATARMGEAARARAIARYGLEATTDAYVAIYERSLAARASPQPMIG